MKVLLYSEGKSSFSKSGVGQALNHQVEALGANNIEITQDPEDDYDLAHINTVALKSYEVLKQAKKKGKPVIYHTHTTYEDFRGSIKGSYVLSPIIKFWTKKLYNEADYLISPSEYTKNLIKSKYLEKEKEIRVISNGVNINKFNKNEVLKNAKKKGKPVIYHTHTTYEDFKGSVKFSNQLAPLIKFWAKKLYNSADYLISPTEYTKNLIKEKYLTSPKEIRVISNGVDTQNFSKREELEKRFREEYKIDKPFIITAGLPFERKGIMDFVKIVEKCKDYQFFWFGSSSIKPMLPKKIQNIIENPPKNLIFPGFVDKEILIGAFSGAKVFLFMTYEENEGIVVLEALSSKLPVVVRDIPVYENWLEDGKNCFKARNNEEFYEKIVNIKEDKVENLNEIVENAYKLAEERDLKNIGKKYRDYYEYILNNAKK